jgi:hypothetical protein
LFIGMLLVLFAELIWRLQIIFSYVVFSFGNFGANFWNV